MPRRTVKIKVSFDVILDDARDGIPGSDEIAAMVATGVTEIKGIVEIRNINLSWGLDRASANELRKRDRVRRANQR